jgi:hypothetical protein
MWLFYLVVPAMLLWVARCSIKATRQRDGMLDSCYHMVRLVSSYDVREFYMVSYFAHFRCLLLGRNPAILYGPLMQLALINSLKGKATQPTFGWCNVYLRIYIPMQASKQRLVDHLMANTGWSLQEAVFVYCGLTRAQYDTIAMEPMPATRLATVSDTVMKDAADEYQECMEGQELMKWRPSKRAS